MKSNLDSFFKTDEKIEKDGVWFTIKDGVGFLIKRFSETNPQIKKAMTMHYKPYARQIDLGTLEDLKVREIMITVFVKSCMVDWKGIVIDGKETPFSTDVAIKFLNGLPELFTSLMNYSSDFKNFKEDPEGEAEDLKNS